MIKDGYKETPCGIIPVEWSCIQLGDAAKVTKLAGFEFSSYVHYCEQGNIIALRGLNVKNGKLVLDDVKYIDKSDFSKLSRSKLYEGDLLFTYVGTIGELAIIDKNDKYYLAPNVALIRLKSSIPPIYCMMLMSCKSFFYTQIKPLISVTSQQSLNMSNIRRLNIAVPPQSEQQRITEILMDMNKLISSLEKLIKKKKAVKKSTAHKLLTGGLRLEGFDGEWETIALNELLEYEQPTKYIVKSTEYTTAGIPVLTAGKSFILGYSNENDGIFDSLPVILFDDFLTLSRYVDFPFKVKSSAVKMLKNKRKDDDLKIIYEIMQLIDFSVGNHQRHWISQYGKIKIKLPYPKEQKAISKILTDMDREIEILEKQLEKYIQINRTAAELLLTGKIRLI